MGVLVATHSGPFHADDVLAWALIRVFRHPLAELIRTRDLEEIERADIVVDVGGEFNVARHRFDHHQTSYTGPLSSAGMVLEWLKTTGDIEVDLAHYLREILVDYVDDVDNGRRLPERDVPCFASMVEGYAQGHQSLDAFTAAFVLAGNMASQFLEGLVRGFEAQREASKVVLQAMKEAEEKRVTVICFETYYKWKPAYFSHGGASHPTQYVLMPGVEGTWRVVAIPPSENSFAQKRPLPASWAGLTGADLVQKTGIEGAIFCHKNRFIAVFETMAIALETLERHNLLALQTP
jgi:uncharacterized UPF0160 family protein